MEMVLTILLSCFTIAVSAVPARPDVLPLLSQGGVQPADTTNQTPDAQTPAPLSPIVEQPRPGVPQQPTPQGGPQFLPPTQYYTWPPLGGSPMFVPLQPSIHGSQPANQLTLPQLPLILTPYGYFPLFSSSYGNQLFSPHGFPMMLGAPLPQTLANQPPNSPVLPAETPSGPAPSVNAPQPMQQQQNPQIVYMLQQPMNPQLGSLSSEELEMAAKIGQLGVSLLSVLANPSAGAVQPVSQAAGLTNPDTGAVQSVNQAAGLKNPKQQDITPTEGTLSAGVPQTQGPASTGQQPNTSAVPEGLQRSAQEVATVQTPVQPKLQPTRGNRV